MYEAKGLTKRCNPNIHIRRVPEVSAHSGHTAGTTQDYRFCALSLPSQRPFCDKPQLQTNTRNRRGRDGYWDAGREDWLREPVPPEVDMTQYRQVEDELLDISKRR